MSTSLKNPFGEKGRRLILISDVPPEENGKNCGCICPLCKGDFQAKKNGKIRQPHFSHLGKPCNETIAFMTALYRFFQQSIEASGSFCPPSVYANLSGLAADEPASLSTIEEHTAFLQTPFEDAEVVLDARPFKVLQCEIVYRKDMPELLLLTAEKKQKQLAVVVVPPATICKEQQAPQPYKGLPTLAVYVDKTVNFYELHSEQLQQKIKKLDFSTKWIKNDKLEQLKRSWLERKLEEHKHEYEKRRKEQKAVQLENQEVKTETFDRTKQSAVPTKELWHTCARCHKRKPESELVYYQNGREDDEAICRECSRKAGNRWADGTTAVPETSSDRPTIPAQEAIALNL